MSETQSASVTPLEGKTTIDDKMLFEPTRLSYQSAAGIAERIADQVKASIRGKLVVIAGVDFLADLANLNAVVVVLEGLKRDYMGLVTVAQGIPAWQALNRASPPEDSGRELAPTRSLAIAPVIAAAQTALGLVSLFRADVDYRGAQTTLDPQAFELALAARLKENKAGKVLVPDFTIFHVGPPDQSSLIAALEVVQGAKIEAWKTIGPVIAELVRLEAELDLAVSEKDQTRVDTLSEQLSELRRNMSPVTEPLSRLDQRLSDLQTRWDQADTQTGLTLLARLLRAESISKQNPLYLHAKVVSSGGHLRTSRSLWRTMFVGDGLSAMGGVVVRWALLGRNGAVVQGGIASLRQGASFPRPSEGAIPG